MKNIKNKVTLAALSCVLIISGASNVMASNVKTQEATTTSSLVSSITSSDEFKSLNPQEREIIKKAYEELEALQIKIDKIQGHKEKLSPEEETMIENLLVQMQAIYDKIEPIESKIMTDVFVGGDCGPMADEDYESSEDGTRAFVNSLDMLSANEKEQLIKAYDEIDKIFVKYDAIDESKIEGPEAQALLEQAAKISESVSHIEDKINNYGLSLFQIGLENEKLEDALKYADNLNIDGATKTELKRLYTDIFKQYDELTKLYFDLGEKEITDEFMKIEEKTVNDLNRLYEQIDRLEEKVK
ncbi:MAG: hypothetical protein GX666_08375 [Tissierellia bacterium]|nr:hypothetical protein [Tissierellia bacterium]